MVTARCTDDCGWTVREQRVRRNAQQKTRDHGREQQGDYENRPIIGNVPTHYLHTTNLFQIRRAEKPPGVLAPACTSFPGHIPASYARKCRNLPEPLSKSGKTASSRVFPRCVNTASPKTRRKSVVMARSRPS